MSNGDIKLNDELKLTTLTVIDSLLKMKQSICYVATK